MNSNEEKEKRIKEIYDEISELYKKLGPLGVELRIQEESIHYLRKQIDNIEWIINEKIQEIAWKVQAP